MEGGGGAVDLLQMDLKDLGVDDDGDGGGGAAAGEAGGAAAGGGGGVGRDSGDDSKDLEGM